jgi:parallel beta-helix repeat protein
MSFRYLKENTKYFLILACTVALLLSAVVSAQQSGPLNQSELNGFGNSCYASFCIFTNVVGATQYYYAQAGLGQGTYPNGVVAFGGLSNAGGASGTNVSQVMKSAFNQGGLMVIEPGTYNVQGGQGGYLTISTPNVAILGEPGSAIQLPVGYNGVFMKVTASNFTMTGVHIKGNLWASTGKNGWVTQGGVPYSVCCLVSVQSGISNLLFQNNLFEDYGYTVTVNTLNGAPVNNTRFVDNTFYNVFQGPFSVGRTFGFIVEGNSIINSYGDAIAVQGGGNNVNNNYQSAGTVIADNYIDGNQWNGAGVDLAAEGGFIYAVSITGNVFTHCYQCIFISDLAPAPDVHLANGWTISGNYFNATNTANAPGALWNIRIKSQYGLWATNGTISGNTFFGNQIGIYFINVSQVLVEGNAFVHTVGPTRAVLAIQDSQNLTFVANTFSMAGNSASPYIQETSQTRTVTGITWVANVFYPCKQSNCGGTSANILIAGANYFVNNVFYNPQPVSSVTAGTSPWTYTNLDGYNEYMYLTSAGGISAETCNGFSVGISVGQVCYLAPGQSMVVTWSGTAPIFAKDPA